MPSTEYRQLGRSGLRVSRLTLGTMGFGGRAQFRDVGETDLDVLDARASDRLDQRGRRGDLLPGAGGSRLDARALSGRGIVVFSI